MADSASRFKSLTQYAKVATQFTEDVLATQMVPCDRPSCQVIIQPGQPRLYMANQNESGNGRYLCAKCHEYYMQKPATSITTVRRGTDHTANIAEPGE